MQFSAMLLVRARRNNRLYDTMISTIEIKV